MNVLLTNDDGVMADGIMAAFDVLSDLANVTVVAPRDASSGASHALSIRTPIEVAELTRRGKCYGFAVTGTPADAVKLGVKILLTEAPDLIVSGINSGLNFGFNSFYSGTVAAALEGTIMGVPSLAISLDVLNGGKYDDAAAILRKLVETFRKAPLPVDHALSINVPAEFSSSPPTYALTRHSRASLIETYHPCDAEAGRRAFILGREYVGGEPEPDSDIAAVRAGMVSIARLSPDLNARSPSREIEEWLQDADLNMA